MTVELAENDEGIDCIVVGAEKSIKCDTLLGPNSELYVAVACSDGGKIVVSLSVTFRGEQNIVFERKKIQEIH